MIYIAAADFHSKFFFFYNKKTKKKHSFKQAIKQIHLNKEH